MKLSKSRWSRIAAGIVTVGCCWANAQAQLLDDAVWFERELGSGVVWRYYQFDDLFSSKQSVSYVEVDLNDPNVSLAVNYREGVVGPSPPIFPRATTSQFASEIPNAKAAINGTFFNTSSYNAENPGAVWGGAVTYVKANGNLIYTSESSNDRTHGGATVFNDKNDITVMRKATSWGDEQSNWDNMLINGPMIVENGIVETFAPDDSFSSVLHPRSAIGVTADNKLILLTVDGRSSQAAGMTCNQLGQVIRELGAVHAHNLDGGGSTTLWGAGEPFSGVLNYPSDNSSYDHLGQRSAANALVVSSSAPSTVAWDARLDSLTYNTVARSNQDLTVTAVYTNIGTETWNQSNVTVIPSRSFGRSSSFLPAGSTEAVYTMTPSTVAPGATATFELTLTPPEVLTDTPFEENFALSNTSTGYFGPADNDLRVSLTVRPELVGAPPPFIVQGGDPGINGQWYFETTTGWGNSTVSFSAPGVSNPGAQRYCGASVANRAAEFRPEFDVAGVYKVEAAFPPSTNNISSVVYTIEHADGTASVTLNQNSSAISNQWNELGEFTFNAGPGQLVRLSNGSTTGNRFYSGAIRFDFVEAVSSETSWSLY